LLASAFVGSRRVESLASAIEAALKRSVNVDLLWGYAATDDGTGSAPLARLKKLAYDAQQRGAPGKLRFNAAPSSSHAKLLIWDGAAGYEACVGSFNWLSAQPAAKPCPTGAIAPGNVSIRVAHPVLVARLARCAAVLWHGAQSEALASTGDRWRRVATDLDRVAASGATEQHGDSHSNCRARIVLDREHESTLREFISSSRERLLVVSHRLGLGAEPRLVTGPVEHAPGYRALVLYGSTDIDASALARVQGRTQNLGATLGHVAGLHAKVIVSDSRAVISSYNFLSADPFGNAARSRELGVIIDGAAPAHWIASRFGLSSDRGRDVG
jgi:phosphatidylserine/phosphatidylglycerophosphate/cardiolipin synthase-like enzyme